LDAIDMDPGTIAAIVNRQNYLGRSLEVDLLCVFYRAKWTRKSRKLQLLVIWILVI
jgi:hypothetical protein